MNETKTKTGPEPVNSATAPPQTVYACTSRATIDGQEVLLDWYAQGRSTALGSPEQLIQDWDSVQDDPDGHYILDSIEQRLTAAEAEALREYVATQDGWTLEVTPIPLPARGWKLTGYGCFSGRDRWVYPDWPGLEEISGFMDG